MEEEKDEEGQTGWDLAQLLYTAKLLFHQSRLQGTVTTTVTI